jgi:hypothetical protein
MISYLKKNNEYIFIRHGKTSGKCFVEEAKGKVGSKPRILTKQLDSQSEALDYIDQRTSYLQMQDYVFVGLCRASDKRGNPQDLESFEDAGICYFIERTKTNLVLLKQLESCFGTIDYIVEFNSYQTVPMCNHWMLILTLFALKELGGTVLLSTMSGESLSKLPSAFIQDLPAQYRDFANHYDLLPLTMKNLPGSKFALELNSSN